MLERIFKHSNKELKYIIGFSSENIRMTESKLTPNPTEKKRS